MEIFKAFAPISKVDEEQRMVYGYASTDTKDSQGDVVKLDAIEKALPDYMRFANIREMHTMSAVGVAKSAEVDDKGLYLGAKVVDETAWIKVKEGVYKGFSIGGKALKKSNGVIEELRLTEISLVDRPANPECVIDTWKAESLDDSSTPATATPEVAKAEELPVVEVDTDAPTGELKKYMGEEVWDARCALNALAEIQYLFEKESAEKEQMPEQIEALRAVIANLKRFIVSEIQEDYSAEPEAAAVAMADSNVELLKAGATYSKATKAALAKVHGMIRDAEKVMCAMGYDKGDDMDKADDAEPVAKADGEALAKAEADLAKVSAERDELAKRVQELEAQPEPAKAVTTTIDKAADTKDGLASPALPQGNPDDPLSMFKAALARPLVVGAPVSKPSSAN